MNRAKGHDTKFEYIKAEPEMLTLGLNGKYAIYFWREDLAKAVGKASQDIDFEKLTDKQYLRLCEYIAKEIWRLVKTI